MTARRLAAILAVDVVGYSRLRGEDEAGTARPHACGQAGQGEGRLAEARRLNPAITIKWMKEHAPNLPAVFDGLRKAGCQRNEASLKGSLRARVRCS